jgi:hypothetical protein
MDQQVMLVIGGASAVANAIFWGAYLLGKITSRIERLETRMDDADEDIRALRIKI